MYFNLALKNIKRSLKDYTIYFLTLIFGVCIFYTFNSINSQSIMMKLSELQKVLFQNINVVMGIASVFVSFILGFLILYANSYLIKRRKKEFGIYMTLGMERGHLSKIIFIETLLIGFLSLSIGLFLGVILSQGLSIFTAKLFQVQLTNFTFTFSPSAAMKTIGCFIIIYLIILIFNNFSLRKIKLIDLLNAKKKNEKLLIKNIWISVILFFISIFMIGSAYYMMLKNGIAIISPQIIFPAVFLGSFGTLLLFFSFAGFILKLVQTRKKYYLKELNMFITRQLNSKINTTFISMTFISLMLFISICTLSGGLGINKAINSNLKDLSQFDMTLWNFNGNNISNILKDNGLNLNDYTKDYSDIEYYTSNIHFNNLLTPSETSTLSNYYPIKTNETVQVIKLSQLNKTLEILNKKPISLKNNQYGIVTDIDDMVKPITKFLSKNTTLTINNKALTPGIITPINEVLYDSSMKANLAVIVVNDSVLNGLTAVNSYLNINSNNNISIICEKIRTIQKKYTKTKNPIYGMTKTEMIENSLGLSAMVSYLAIYLGLIFIIASAALLAIQQLTESTDNAERYKLLQKVGVDNSMINKSLFIQIGIYFLIPLVVALIHSIVGLKIASTVVKAFGAINITRNIIITLLSVLLIYGSYFFATYIGAKNNIKKNLK